MSGLESRLREAKHRSAVFLKHAGWGFPHVRGPLWEPVWAWHQRRHPKPFVPSEYAHEWFASSRPDRQVTAGEPVPRRIFVVWTGHNAMSEARTANLERIRAANPDVDVVLVSPANLADWLVPDHPLPPEYDYLSLVHRSDYLRAYLLHHHGGGYADVKRPRHPWASSFAALEASDAWLLGYTERHRLLIPLVGGRLQRDLRRVSQQLLGYGALIARRDTPLTGEWLARANAVLAENSASLARTPGNVRGDNPGYPLAWTQILAHIVAPLTWKYQAKVIHDDRVRPELKGYL